MRKEALNDELLEQEQLERSKLGKILAIVSFLLWVISLGLVGLSFGDRGMRGLEILFAGILFGWMNPMWWTVYSNVFYIYAQFSLLRGKIPEGSTSIMSFLSVALILNFFMDVSILRDESGSTSTVSSWGWGAFILLFSQFLLGLAVLLLNQKISKKLSYCLISMVVVALGGVGSLGIWQRHQANDWEYETYFSPKNGLDSDGFLPFEIAFTKATLSGLPYVPFTEKLTPNATIELETLTTMPEFILKQGDIFPNAYWQNGKYLKKDPNSSYKDVKYIESKEVNIPKPSYSFRITQPKDKYLLCTLYDLKNGKIIYQQPFLIGKDKYGEGTLTPYYHVIPIDIRNIDKSIKD